jgi:hypothetical protein
MNEITLKDFLQIVKESYDNWQKFKNRARELNEAANEYERKSNESLDFVIKCCKNLSEGTQTVNGKLLPKCEINLEYFKNEK